MGVFSWFRGKPAAAEEAPASPVTPAPSERSAEASAEQPEATDGTAPPEAEPEAKAGAEADGVAPAEALEIPRQQSAEDAADSEAGEGARK